MEPCYRTILPEQDHVSSTDGAAREGKSSLLSRGHSRSLPCVWSRGAFSISHTAAAGFDFFGRHKNQFLSPKCFWLHSLLNSFSIYNIHSFLNAQISSPQRQRGSFEGRRAGTEECEQLFDALTMCCVF